VKLRDVLAIGIAVVMAYGIISAWPTSDSQLTWFQSLAIRFGLVHGSNQAPVFVGNPEARVWVDVHTSLYYCEGADLYGKTPEGEFMTQHDAQGSHFDPASQAPCP
jgi:hypothetical protein